MKYWKAVVEEVLNKDNPEYPCYFTNIRSCEENSSRYKKLTSYAAQQEQSRHYLLAKGYEDIYFTPREMETLRYLMMGLSIKGTAEKMALSNRTVEYYIKNMRLKLEVSNKIALLRKVRELNVMPELVE